MNTAWDLSAIYTEQAAFDADFQKCAEAVRAFADWQAKLTESPENLHSMFTELFSLQRVMLKLYEYASRHYDVDTSVNEWQSLQGKVVDLFRTFGQSSYFVNPAILKLGKKKIDAWCREYPPLGEYRRALDDVLRYADHTLKPEEEKLLSTVNLCLGTHEDIYGVMHNADMKFGKIRGEDGKMMTLTDANYVTCLQSQNRAVRRAAFRTLYTAYDQFRNTFAGLLNGFVREKTACAKVRSFPSSLDASVFSDEVGSDIYRNLISTVEQNLPVLFSYYDLKREMLKLPKLHMYDVYTPMIASHDRSFTYEQAVDTVLEALSVLGSEYTDILRAGLVERGWVDVYPQKGKRSGAYSAGSFDTEPYILLNFEGKLDDVSTLAHEAGHSMHSYFSRTSNPFHESEYTIFVAEVASTVNELLLMRHLLAKAQDKDEKMSILNQLMETYKGTLFRQTMFARFEMEIHALAEEGEVLTADLLCDRYYGIVRQYFGSHVVCDDSIKDEWMRIPHFYYNFYVYKYATCISAAASIVRRMEQQGKDYIRKYLDFLRCGGSRSPLESLLVCDIDLRQPQVIQDAIDMFADVISQFRTLM